MNIPPKRSTSPPMGSPPIAGVGSGSGSPPSIASSPQERALSISPPSELSSAAIRHVQSHTALYPTVARHPNRLSAHLGKGTAKSPATSIPSSPTSVHSSSSAIFERDIEPIAMSSSSSMLSAPGVPITSHPHTNPHLPHGRVHAIDASVPAVLDSATEILATLSPEEVAQGDIADTIAVVAPASTSFAAPTRSGFSSPSGGGGKTRSLSSRSPSPVPTGPHGTIRAVSSGGALGGGSLMLNIAPVPPPSLPPSGIATARPPNINTTVAATASDTPSIVTPTSLHPSIPIAASSSPTAAEGHFPAPRSPKHAISSLAPSTAPSTNKRLSFLSYNDILSSTPASTMPLSSLTTSARSDLPPSHLPEVDAGLHSSAGVGSATSSPRMTISSMSGEEGLLTWRKDVSMQNNPIGVPGGAGPMDEGGEWEREGLGMGLEERLEAIEMLSSPPSAMEK